MLDLEGEREKREKMCWIEEEGLSSLIYVPSIYIFVHNMCFIQEQGKSYQYKVLVEKSAKEIAPMRYSWTPVYHAVLSFLVTLVSH